MNKVERKTHKIDATGQSLGRLATQIALLLRGKNKPEFQAHLDLGDIVEVTNIDKLKFTGKKLEQKEYYQPTGYIGNLKTTKMAEVYAKNPALVLERAVRQMLPATRLRPAMLKRLIIR